MSSENLFYHLIRKTHFAFKYLNKKRIFIASVAILGGLTGLIYAINESPKYTATVSFVLSSESKTGNISGLASQFGIDLGNGAGTDLFSGDNIISLLYSKKMIKRVIFKSTPEDPDLLINMIVRDLQLDKKWAKKNRLVNSFPFQNKQLSKVQDSLINEVFNKIKIDILEVSRPDRMMNVYTVTAHSHNELFTCYLTKYLVDEAANFYIETKTRLAKQNLMMLQKEADSIKILLGNSISSIASEVDRTFNLNPALQIKKSSIQKQQINSTVLTAAYGEVIKNLELAKINLQKETPLYQVLDEPELPLKAKKTGKALASVIGFFAAIVLIIPFLLIRKKITEVISKESLS